MTTTSTYGAGQYISVSERGYPPFFRDIKIRDCDTWYALNILIESPPLTPGTRGFTYTQTFSSMSLTRESVH